MSKQNLTITVVLIVSLVLGGLFGFYFYLNKKTGGELNNDVSRSFFGFGSTRSVIPTPSEPSEVSTTTPVVTVTVPKPIPVLRHLTEAPVAGAAFVMKDIVSTSTTIVGSGTKTIAKIVGSAEMFRWVDRATGNIFETSSTTLETLRISNTTIPKIYEAYFVGGKNSNVIFRDLLYDTDVIRTRHGTLQMASATSSEQMLKLTDLPTNITQLAVSPSQDQIFSISTGNSRGVISKTDGSSQSNVFNSPFHEWLVSWPTAQTVVLNTKPSGLTEGYSYTFDTKTRSFVKLIGNRKGLTTLMSPDGSSVLVGESPLGTIQMNVFNRKTGMVRDLFVRTFPEKCVWSRKEVQIVFCAIPENIRYDTYPDAWYMGRISFSDSIWRIDTSTGENRRLVQPVALVGQIIDVINPSLSRNEDFLMFQNKTDLSLWSYQLNSLASTTKTQ
ncbi:MAG: hypothetical protein V4664_01760 [Patescibacteria group bacterium]